MLFRRLMTMAASFTLALMLASVGPRSAQAQIVDGLLGFLGVHEEKPEVEYRERAPLVVPPKTGLRPPQEQAAAKNTAWPKDPDVQRRKAANAAARMPVTETEEYKRALNSHLPIDQVRAGRKAGAGLSTEPAPMLSDNARESNWIHPDNLRSIGAKARQADGGGSGVACDGREAAPDRRYLTEPPSALRKCVAGFQGRTTRGAVDVKAIENDEASPYAVLTKKPQSDD